MMSVLTAAKESLGQVFILEFFILNLYDESSDFFVSILWIQQNWFCLLFYIEHFLN